MAKTVLVVAGLPDALVNFRGPLLRAMVDRGHRVVACASPGDALSGINGDFEAAIQRLGVEFRPIRIDRTSADPRRDIATYRDIRRAIRDVKPDVTFSFGMKALVWTSFAGAAAHVQHRVGLMTGVPIAMRHAGMKVSLPNRVGQWLYEKAIRRNTCAIFQNSDDSDQHIREGLLPQGFPITVVNGSGVDLTRYELTAPATDPMTYLCIARLLTDKGVREFAGACRILKKKWPQARCILVGPFDKHPLAISKAEVDAWIQEGILEYPGPSEDVRVFLRECSVYVLPSYREGTPRTVLEAMAMGRPIVTTDAPGCRQTTQNGVNGFLVPLKDEAATAEAMGRFMEDTGLVASMGAASRQIAEEKYDVHKVNLSMLKAMDLE